MEFNLWSFVLGFGSAVVSSLLVGVFLEEYRSCKQRAEARKARRRAEFYRALEWAERFVGAMHRLLDYVEDLKKHGVSRWTEFMGLQVGNKITELSEEVYVRCQRLDELGDRALAEDISKLLTEMNRLGLGVTSELESLARSISQQDLERIREILHKLANDVLLAKERD